MADIVANQNAFSGQFAATGHRFSPKEGLS